MARFSLVPLLISVAGSLVRKKGNGYWGKAVLPGALPLVCCGVIPGCLVQPSWLYSCVYPYKILPGPGTAQSGATSNREVRHPVERYICPQSRRL